MAAAVGGLTTGQAAMGAASIGGGILGGLLDFPIQKSFNVGQTRHARNFAREMSNTQYQRAVADLKAAGLNPMLAYTQGGASSPQYMAAQTPSLDFDVDVGRAAESAQGVGIRNAELKNMQKQLEILDTDLKSRKAFADKAGEKAEAEVEAIRSGAEASLGSAAQAAGSKKVLDEEAKVRAADAASAKTLMEMRGTEPGKALIILREILNSTRR